ncbi:hypothetical protein M758_2G117900 [Ceratodon purpureus]|nr:hypothetical protein M758_2G117900 [Ceratodon purpureus]
MAAMTTSMFANTATAASSLMQRSIRSSELASSSKLVNLSSWQSKPLRAVTQSDGKSGGSRSQGNGAVRATVTAYRDLDSDSNDVSGSQEASTSELLCCPICFQPLIRNGPSGLTQAAIKKSGFSCKGCRRGFTNRGEYLDLTILEGARVYDEDRTSGTELFRSPLVSFVYERGWRQNFARAGFPGPDEEFKMAQEYFKPVQGGVLLDVSCGSGLFTRRFAQSGDYKSVIALDFSENMLRQSNEFIKQDMSLRNSNIALVRADVARLPFASGSIDAVHAGAALHCWPSPAAGMAEISRILKPGGVFVATTFLSPIPIIDFGSKDIRKAIKGAISSSTLRYWEEQELEELCGSCGLVEYSRIRRNQFIMISAKRVEDSEA